MHTRPFVPFCVVSFKLSTGTGHSHFFSIVGDETTMLLHPMEKKLHHTVIQ